MQISNIPNRTKQDLTQKIFFRQEEAETYPGNTTTLRREALRLYFFKKLWYNIIRKLRKEWIELVYHEPATPEEYEADVRKSFQEV